MYPDNTLTPKEATRLCALGSLAVSEGPLHYRALATTVRHFMDRVLGPSLDLMAPSIELLKYEGLIRPVVGQGFSDDAAFVLTDEGHDALRRLLTAQIRNQATDLNKLIIALKFRFLHLLDKQDQQIQIEMLQEYYEAELARLDDLRQYYSGNGGYLPTWLDHDVSLVETRLAWLGDFRKTIS
jgi:DNA-binding PadR family transcriptional regulator